MLKKSQKLSFDQKPRHIQDGAFRLFHFPVGEGADGDAGEVAAGDLLQVLPHGLGQAEVGTGAGAARAIGASHQGEGAFGHANDLVCVDPVGGAGEAVTAVLAAGRDHQSATVEHGNDGFQIFQGDVLSLGNGFEGDISFAFVLCQVDHHKKRIPPLGRNHHSLTSVGFLTCILSQKTADCNRFLSSDEYVTHDGSVMQDGTDEGKQMKDPVHIAYLYPQKVDRRAKRIGSPAPK